MSESSFNVTPQTHTRKYTNPSRMRICTSGNAVRMPKRSRHEPKKELRDQHRFSMNRKMITGFECLLGFVICETRSNTQFATVLYELYIHSVIDKEGSQKSLQSNNYSQVRAITLDHSTSRDWHRQVCYGDSCQGCHGQYECPDLKSSSRYIDDVSGAWE
jgi:hypothetical protein